MAAKEAVRQSDDEFRDEGTSIFSLAFVGLETVKPEPRLPVAPVSNPPQEVIAPVSNPPREVVASILNPPQEPLPPQDLEHLARAAALMLPPAVVNDVVNRLAQARLAQAYLARARLARALQSARAHLAALAQSDQQAALAKEERASFAERLRAALMHLQEARIQCQEAYTQHQKTLTQLEKATT